MKLANKVAIVTGGGSGIGRAVGLAFAREGANVVIADENGQDANRVVEEVQALGRRGVGVKVDVSSKMGVNRMVEEAMKSFQRLDILATCVGIAKASYFEDLTEEDWDEIMNTNLKGTYLCCQATGRQMIKQRGGVIVNVSTISGEMPEIYTGAYSMSRAGVITLTRLLAMEWAKYNIRVNTVSIGVISSPLEDKFYTTDEAIKERSRTLPLARLGKPEDVANAVVFLASEDSSYITGDTVHVDGGLLQSYYLVLGQRGGSALAIARRE